jgi:hypothetical protein
LSSDYIYDCNASGGSTLSDRKLVYKFYTESNLVTPIKTIEYPTTTIGNVKKTLDLSGLTHGAYFLKVQATGRISGGVNVDSNTLTHKLLYFDSADGSPVFSVLVPEKTEQFSNIPLQALLVTGGANKEYTLEIKLNGKVETQLKITAHTPLTYNLLFEELGKYTLNMTVVELAKTFTTLLEITKYTGDLPVIDTERDDLDLYLNPRGKTNEVLDRDIWVSHNGKHTAQLENFYYGDINEVPEIPVP